MNIRKFQNADLKNKRVLLRVDFNVPMKDGKVAEDTRIVQTLPTIQYLLKQNAKVIICSHLGRPEGKVVEEMRMKAAAEHMGKLLNKEVKIMEDCIGPNVEQAAKNLQSGEILFLENLRFHIGEEKNDPAFAKQLAGLAEVFVSDSFATAHRAHGSTAGVSKYLPSYAGYLMQKEVEVLGGLVQKPAKPLTVIVAGAKIDTKIGIIENFLGKANNFLIGGGLANTFLSAEGFNVGKSLYEPNKIEVAQDTLMAAEQLHINFVLPEDVIVADEIKDDAQTLDIPVDDVIGEMKILDIGTRTIQKFINILQNSKTVIWNGPVGLSEMKPFSNGTRAIAETLAKAKNVQSILGGGDTIEAIKRFGYEETDFTFVSTGGGAMLEFLEGKTLPGVEVLMEKENVKNESKTITKAKSSKKPAKKAKKVVKSKAKNKPKKGLKKVAKKAAKKNAASKKVSKKKTTKVKPSKKSSKKPAKKVPKKVAKKSLKKSSKKPLKKTSKKNAGKKKTKATKESKKRPALKKNAAAKKKGKKRR